MTTSTESGESRVVSPKEAFAVLGDEARFEILQALGEANDPLAYSDLFERIDYDDLSNLSYHLDKLVGHFVAKTDAGYVLRPPGERVLVAVLSGAVTTDPVRELAQTDRPCPICSAGIEVGYEQERVVMHCPECAGMLRQAEVHSVEAANLGYRLLPPAAVDGRTAAAIHDVAKTWTGLTVHALGRGVCPRCAGTIEHSMDVCESHNASEGICDRCGQRFGALAVVTCTNCPFDAPVGVAAYLVTRIEVMAFLIEHGVDPLSPEDFHPYAAIEETIRSHDPFEARYTYTVDDDTLTVTVDADLSIVDTTRGEVRGAD